MSLLDLPPELVQAILDHIRDDKKLLYALSITCRFLNPHANRLLYSRVRLHYHPDLFRFSRTMLDNPRLASSVRSFSGPLFHVRLSEASDPLEGWLQNIVNLRYLHLTPCPKTQFRLESLEVCYYGARSIPSKDLMQVHPDFVNISNFIFGLLEAWPLSPLAFPGLKVLRGSIYAASAVLPGRKVIRFEWDYLFKELARVPAEVISSMSDQLDKLRSLSFWANDMLPIEMFGALPNISLKSLRFLEIQKMHEQVSSLANPLVLF
ncbi:hypothetical protein GALMADRAFT_211648 [Galerina marginata CBS 339.88]|uniref:F-box domain-containing protein n=1 Tax=Galerina marginata (strain CBS 339.88) TaxID=685588 RepID=A0A067SUQ9_GALM3|nr:hypothetical protein GALMADRAFT_211648 [Galerina marginata CBS 339.88]